MAANVANTKYQVPETKTNVAYEIADFLFGVKSIEKIATGKGSWGDLLNVGVTAAMFFIPPARLLKLPSSALSKIAVSSEKVIANETASIAAKNAAQKTLNGINDVKISRGEIKSFKKGEYKPDVTTPEDVRTIDPNIKLGKNATAEDLAEYERLQGPAEFMKRNPDVKDPSFITNKNDIPSVETSGKAVRNSEKAADQELNRTLNRGTPEQIKTAQKIDELNLKTPRESKARSAIQPEIDQMSYDKEGLQSLLTGELNKEATGKVTNILRRWANETADENLKRQYFRDIKDIKDNKLSANLVQRIQGDIKKLDKRIEKFQGYIEDPTSSAAIRQTDEFIPAFRRGKYEPVKPRSYQAKESVKKTGKSPDSPQRSTLSELKSDEESLMNLLEKESNPTKRAELRSDLKRTREEIFNAEVGRGRQYIDDTAQLQKELNDLRKQWLNTKSQRGKEEIKKRGQEVAARLAEMEGN